MHCFDVDKQVPSGTETALSPVESFVETHIPNDCLIYIHMGCDAKGKQPSQTVIVPLCSLSICLKQAVVFVDSQFVLIA